MGGRRQSGLPTMTRPSRVSNITYNFLRSVKKLTWCDPRDPFRGLFEPINGEPGNDNDAYKSSKRKRNYSLIIIRSDSSPIVTTLMILRFSWTIFMTNYAFWPNFWFHSRFLMNRNVHSSQKYHFILCQLITAPKSHFYHLAKGYLFIYNLVLNTYLLSCWLTEFWINLLTKRIIKYWPNQKWNSFMLNCNENWHIADN